jgi:hypothetical protein
MLSFIFISPLVVVFCLLALQNPQLSGVGGLRLSTKSCVVIDRSRDFHSRHFGSGEDVVLEKPVKIRNFKSLINELEALPEDFKNVFILFLLFSCVYFI